MGYQGAGKIPLRGLIEWRYWQACSNFLSACFYGLNGPVLNQAVDNGRGPFYFCEVVLVLNPNAMDLKGN